MARRIGLLVVWLVLAVALSGTASHHHVIAELQAASGGVQRDRALSVGAWKPTKPPATFELGDGIRTGPKGEADVALRGGGQMRLESNTTIRFRSSPTADRSVRIETGSALLEAGASDLRLETDVGLAVIDKGGTLRLTARGNGLRFEVVVGTAHLETAGGEKTLGAGATISVSVGGAVFEEEDAGAPAVAHASADAGADAPEEKETFVAEVSGRGVRIRPHGKRAFEPLPAGSDDVSSGDVLRVPAGGRVTVRSGRRHTTLVGKGEYVVGGPRPVLVRAVRGRMHLETDGEDVVVAAPGGTITARADEGRTNADVVVTPREAKVSVREGRVELRGQGAPQVLRAGEQGALDARGTLEANAAAAARADFHVHAGDSFVVRDPRPPSAIGFDFFGACQNAGVVVVGGAHIRGDGHAAVLLSAGAHHYAVHCIGPKGVENAAVASGRVIVVADSGLAQLPRTPPATQVDADGRRYTVLYQNQLPSVIARWPNAPSAGGYVLHWDKHTQKTRRASLHVSRSSLSEGTHSLWFETADASKHSPTTTLVLRFDNAAPSASVSSPGNGSFQPGDTVQVAGVAVEGWSVSVGGKPLPLDAEKRFDGSVTVPAGDSGLGIRLSHPTRGIVYYVRHARGSR